MRKNGSLCQYAEQRPRLERSDVTCVPPDVTVAARLVSHWGDKALLRGQGAVSPEAASLLSAAKSTFFRSIERDR